MKGELAGAKPIGRFQVNSWREWALDSGRRKSLAPIASGGSCRKAVRARANRTGLYCWSIAIALASCHVVLGDVIKAQHSCGKKCGKNRASLKNPAQYNYIFLMFRIPLPPPLYIFSPMTSFSLGGQVYGVVS